MKLRAATAAPIPLTVTQLTRRVRDAIRAALPETLYVVGEISNFSRPASGHVYFTLKDETSEVRCVMWRSDAAALRFRPEDGMAVIVTGQVDVYEPRGQYQLYVRRIEPRGVGALELAFRQLKERLGREGLFDPARKRPLPPFPRRIAIVTSPTGAAIRDMLQTLRRRFPAVHVLVMPVRVQGEGAAEEIAAAIREIDRQAERLGGIEVMIVGRGGGSLEDLWAFNEEVVARAIFACRIPVVSAVGHEVDFTIADFVADVRAATPTAAAELVVPTLADVLSGLDQQQRRMTRGVCGVLDMARAAVRTVERSEWFRDPLGRIRQYQQLVDEVLSRLRLALSRGLSQGRSRLHAAEVGLQRVRPEAVMARRRERLGEIEHRLRWAQGHANLVAERCLAAATSDLLRATPLRIVERHGLLLTQARARLLRAESVRLAQHGERLAAFAARLEAGSHEKVLRRGFSITRRKRGRRIVRGPRDVRVDERIITQTAGGEIHSRIVDAGQEELFG